VERAANQAGKRWKQVERVPRISTFFHLLPPVSTFYFF